MLRAWKGHVVPNSHNEEGLGCLFPEGMCYLLHHEIREKNDTPLSDCHLKCEEDFFFPKTCL